MESPDRIHSLSQSCRERGAEGTHRTIEGQEGLEQLILGEEWMPRH